MRSRRKLGAATTGCRLWGVYAVGVDRERAKCRRLHFLVLILGGAEIGTLEDPPEDFSMCACWVVGVGCARDEEVLAVARAEAEEELADPIHFGDAFTETAPRLEGAFVAKPEVLESDLGWLCRALLVTTPSCDGGVELRKEENLLFEF